jgi:hypothetical protein
MTIQCASRDLMEQRLPQMCAGSIDKRDMRLVFLSEFPAEADGQFQSAGPASHNGDSVRCRTGGLSQVLLP